jgi:antitoxin (DNA-binding transcriptional repressor) of toxin-antitoxin stability system
MGIRELRDTLTKTMRDVRGGETIEITHDGRPFARISPLQGSRIEQLAAAGLVTLPKGPLRLGPLHPVTGPMTASEALEEDRSGR